MEEIKDTQIEAWKRQWGDVFKITVEDSVCYLRKPDRQTIKAVATLSQNDPIRSSEIMLENCWIVGDEAIKTDDAKFLAVAGQMAALVEVKTAELKKL